MNKLYPLKFKPILKDKIWGGSKLKLFLNKDYSPLPNCGESWEISGVEGNISIVSDGFLKGNNLQELIEVYMGDLVGDKIYENFGTEFPLLIKFIDANDILSIQVHPDNELSRKRHQAYGKTEMWYIIQADENAELISGFNKKTNKEEYIENLEKNTLKSILNFEKVKSGNVFFIPAGRVHAIGPGILLAEIQQTSDITYRIYDWNRKDANGKSRKLHTELALDAIDFDFHKNYRTQYNLTKNISTKLVACNYFTTNILNIDNKLNRDLNGIDSFTIYMCLEGEVKLKYDENEESAVINKGETILVPAIYSNIDLMPVETSKLLEIYID